MQSVKLLEYKALIERQRVLEKQAREIKKLTDELKDEILLMANGRDSFLIDNVLTTIKTTMRNEFVVKAHPIYNITIQPLTDAMKVSA